MSPTPRMVALMAVGVPLTLLLGLVAPGLWAMGAMWIVVVVGLAVLDVANSPRPTQARVEIEAPAALHVGNRHEVIVRLHLPPNARPIHRGDAALTVGHRLRAAPATAPIISGGVSGIVSGGDRALAGTQTWEPPGAQARAQAGERAEARAGARFEIDALRRGDGELERVWLRWTGPLGLMRLGRAEELARNVAIIPDTRLVRDTAARIFTRDAVFGQKIQRRRGEGTEFDSLVEFTTGMDRRAIDWKHSARHSKLHAKEFRTERNHNIVFAVDSGHLMSEPAPDRHGKALTKLDRALGAALLMGFVSLKMGDRVGWFAFDERPYLYTKPVAGVAAFPHLQALSARIDYSDAETNFVLGLSDLSRRLNRRSLIVVFTDFVDTVSAELMVENITRLMRRHLVVFVAFRDPEVEAIITKCPDNAEDIARAVVAETLSMERDLVMAKLQRLGVQVLDADPDTLDMALINRFLDIKRRELL